MTKIELSVVEAFLASTFGTPEMNAALEELIEMADVNRHAWDAKDRARLAKKEGFK